MDSDWQSVDIWATSWFCPSLPIAVRSFCIALAWSWPPPVHQEAIPAAAPVVDEVGEGEVVESAVAMDDGVAEVRFDAEPSAPMTIRPRRQTPRISRTRPARFFGGFGRGDSWLVRGTVGCGSPG
ncbi:hypothetical protein [Streptomyces sp. RPT161]|uniref:hypothetical protein n=1 Tax=Streptomyces sp. RPT161 TaxID=3015993 RepID=UPI0022B858AD|nr:hypothetical protein [Streptomyces sp. RPT161]